MILVKNIFKKITLFIINSRFKQKYLTNANTINNLKEKIKTERNTEI
jgi:hypothetical protein